MMPRVTPFAMPTPPTSRYGRPPAAAPVPAPKPAAAPPQSPPAPLLPRDEETWIAVVGAALTGGAATTARAAAAIADAAVVELHARMLPERLSEGRRRRGK
jgi:hypothetical protein